MQQIILKVLARHTDSQDGSYYTQFYNNRDELAEDLQNNEEEVTVEEIENGDDPYENGTISEITLNITVDDNGVARLSESVGFSTG